MKLMIAPLTIQVAAALAGLTLLAGGAGAQAYPACQQDHSNGARRTES